jgi:hypothetical protein
MMVAVVTTHVKSRRRKKTKQTKRNLKKRYKMNTEFFKTRLEEVRSNLIVTRAEKGKALEKLLERNLIQDLKEALRNKLSLLLQTEEKYLELARDNTRFSYNVENIRKKIKSPWQKERQVCLIT